MKRLLAWLGFFPLVWAIDHQRRPHLRIVRSDRFGGWIFRSAGFGDTYWLRSDGEVECANGIRYYYHFWREWEHNKKHVVFPEQP